MRTRLDAVRADSIELIDQTTHAAPAAVSIAPILLNGTTGTRLPSAERWATAITNDDECKLILLMIRKPEEWVKKNIDKVHFIYRNSLRNGLIVEEHGSLFLKEVFPNDTKFVKLRIVPTSLRNMIYVAFHCNPIGGHLNAFRTYFRIRLRYFWPGIFQFCKTLTRC